MTSARVSVGGELWRALTGQPGAPTTNKCFPGTMEMQSFLLLFSVRSEDVPFLVSMLAVCNFPLYYTLRRATPGLLLLCRLFTDLRVWQLRSCTRIVLLGPVVPVARKGYTVSPGARLLRCSGGHPPPGLHGARLLRALCPPGGLCRQEANQMPMLHPRSAHMCPVSELSLVNPCVTFRIKKKSSNLQDT